MRRGIGLRVKSSIGAGLGGSTAACSCGGLGGQLPGRVLRGFGLWLKSHVSADLGSFDSRDIGCCVGYRDPAGCSGGGLGGQLPGGVLRGFRRVRGCQTLMPRTLTCSSKSDRGSLSLQLRSLLSPHIPQGIHMESISFQVDSTHSTWNMFWVISQPFW